MRVAVLLGTRPEAIKLAPVIRALSCRADVRLVLSGQHREMVDSLLDDLELIPDCRLMVMEPGQTLNSLSERLIGAISRELHENRPDALVVQGDTTTAFCGSLAAFHESIPVAHVEAGLRSHDLSNPFPEEANRRLISQLATWHFAPTSRAAENLIREGHPSLAIEVTGNTVIDSLRWVQERRLGTSAFTGRSPRRLLVTLHRRETQGAEMSGLCAALGEIANGLDLEVVLPIHRSPSVRASIFSALDGNGAVRLLEPLSYVDFIATLADATLVLTDSGGVQEEAPSLGVPVLVARKTTERSEAIDTGWARLIGTEPSAVIAAVTELIDGRAARSAIPVGDNPFGDGHASARIADRLMSDLAPPGVPNPLVSKQRTEERSCA